MVLLTEGAGKGMRRSAPTVCERALSRTGGHVGYGVGWVSAAARDAVFSSLKTHIFCVKEVTRVFLPAAECRA